MNQKNIAYVNRVTAVRVNACMIMISLRRSHSKPSRHCIGQLHRRLTYDSRYLRFNDGEKKKN